MVPPAVRHPQDFRPPLALGGHQLVGLHLTDDVSPTLWRCTFCLAMIPRWAIYEGLWSLYAARWCWGRTPALESFA